MFAGRVEQSNRRTAISEGEYCFIISFIMFTERQTARHNGTAFFGARQARQPAVEESSIFNVRPFPSPSALCRTLCGLHLPCRPCRAPSSGQTDYGSFVLAGASGTVGLYTSLPCRRVNSCYFCTLPLCRALVALSARLQCRLLSSTKESGLADGDDRPTDHFDASDRSKRAAILTTLLFRRRRRARALRITHSPPGCICRYTRRYYVSLLNRLSPPPPVLLYATGYSGPVADPSLHPPRNLYTSLDVVGVERGERHRPYRRAGCIDDNSVRGAATAASVRVNIGNAI